MEFSFQIDAAARLLCTIRDTDGEHVVSASSADEALGFLREAVRQVQTDGFGECFWQDAASEYRWLFRREGELVRIAVLRMTGVVPGYQHVAWSEMSVEAFLARMDAELRAADVTGA